MDIVERFINYTKINTTTVVNAGLLPSSPNQYKLAQLLKKELNEMGITDVQLSDTSILIATLPSNTTKLSPVVAFCAHLDTSSEYKGDTKAQILKYTGSDLTLNKEKNIVLSKKNFPQLDNYLNEDIIVTDGTSLLGADNKSAIAEIMNALSNITKDNREHGEVKILFVPDEEQGLLGAKAVDTKALGADFCYTLDCGPVGEIVTENWNAGVFHITFHGTSAHPMSSKGKLVNSLLHAHKFISMLPGGEAPEYTEKREGYFWVKRLTGNSQKTVLMLDIRDFYKKTFKKRKMDVERLVQYFNDVHGEGTAELVYTEKYVNVNDSLQGDNSYPIDIALKAMKNLNITPSFLPMRGGYDGAVLSRNGLPTPNLFCGAYNFHSIYEFIPVSSLRIASQMVEEIIKLTVNINKK